MENHLLQSEFIPYIKALALKELGFNEPCIAWYNTKNEFYMVYQPGYINGKKTNYIATNINYNNTDETCSAPLYQQVFKWFRENHNYNTEVGYRNAYKDYLANLYPIQPATKVHFCGTYKNYEQAELACLNKLILICKNEKQSNNKV